MLPSGLLWKYIGLDEQGKPRTNFIEDRLFRITQPRSLNDPFEMKPRVLLDKYSTEDRTVARNQAISSGFYQNGIPDDEEIERFFLTPYPADRYDEKNFPGLWPARIPEFREEPFNTIAEVDEFRTNQVRDTLENYLNDNFGIFSLTENPAKIS